MELIIKQQETTITGLKKSIKENQEKAEVIYENYEKIKKILTEINKAKKTMSWKEIKKELPKNVKILEKEKKIILDIDMI